jgi:glycosyltransferase involved in cell wall biosynthesis
MGYAGNVEEIYPQLDICVMPTNSPEPFGLVAVEAGAFGLPVIVTNCGGLPEIVDDGITGLLVEPGDANQLADRLKWLVENPERARAMGLQAREKILREFNQEKMISDFERVFESAGRAR